MPIVIWLGDGYYTWQPAKNAIGWVLVPVDEKEEP